MLEWKGVLRYFKSKTYNQKFTDPSNRFCSCKYLKGKKRSLWRGWGEKGEGGKEGERKGEKGLEGRRERGKERGRERVGRKGKGTERKKDRAPLKSYLGLLRAKKF